MILDTQWARERPLVEVLKDAAEAGVRLFQFRTKTTSIREAYRQAVELRRKAMEFNATFIVNDRCDLALAVEADGVHLGQQDLHLPFARKILGPRKIIGISTHRPQEVLEATQGGADYLGFGPIGPTRTKLDHELVVGIEGLKQIRPLTTLPVFGIGGITVHSAEEIIAAGANGVAVASAVFQAPDVGKAVQCFMKKISSACGPAA